MTISVGDRVPAATFRTMTPDGPAPKTSEELFKGKKVVLFAEGPTPDWALPIPAPVTGAPPGLRRFAFDLDGLPPGASAKGATLRLTAATDQAAIEITTTIE